MLRKIALIVCLALLCISNTFAADPSDAENKFIADAADTISFLNTHQASIWPMTKINISTTPIIVFFPNTQHTYAFNFKPQTERSYLLWTKNINAWETKTQGNFTYYYLDNNNFQISSDLSKKYNAHQTIEEQENCFLYKATPSEINTKEMITILFKELINHEISGPISLPSRPNYNALNNPENMALMFLEIKILQDATNPDAMKDYAIVNHYRLSLLDGNSLAYEILKDVTHGIASYFAWNSHFTQDDYTQFLNPYTLPDLALLQTTNSTLLENNLKSAQDLGLNFSAITDPIIGKTLSDVYPMWQLDRVKSLDNTISELLYQHYFPANDMSLNDLNTIKTKYGYDDILKSTYLIVDYLNSVIKKYDDTQGTELVVDLVDDNVDITQIDNDNGRISQPKFFRINNHQSIYLAYRTVNDEPLSTGFEKHLQLKNFLDQPFSPLYKIRHYNKITKQWHTIIKVKFPIDTTVSYYIIKPDGSTSRKKVIMPLNVFLTNTNFSAIHFQNIDIDSQIDSSNVNYYARLHDNLKVKNDNGSLKITVTKK